MAFGSVHNHSDGSNTRGFMDSTIKVEDLIEYARELNHIGVVLTDHDTITNHKRALNYITKAKKENPEKWKDFKFGLGNEIYLCGRKDIEEDKKYKFYHFILIAKDLIGHEQIRTLSTRAWVDESFTWVNIRTPTYYDSLFEIVEADRGHLIASTACLGGQCPEYILDAYKENPNNPNYKRARTWLKRMEQCFGKGNFFLELQPSLQEDQKIVNKAYIQLSEELDIPYIWTNDSHYLRKEDRPVHEAFLKSNDDGGKEREVGDFYASTYLMSEEEIHSYTDDYLGYDVVQKGLNNTKLIFDQIEEYSLDQELVIPYQAFEDTEPDKKLIDKYGVYMPILKEFSQSEHECDRHVVKLVLEKIESNQEELANQDVYNAIDDNLNTLKILSEKTGQQWSGYLIETRELIEACWEAGSLVGPARGCFVPETLILMGDGTQKRIDEIKKGDIIYSHLGEKRKVLKTFSYNVEEELIGLRTNNPNINWSTKDHKYYIKQCKPCLNPIYKNSWCTDNCRIKKHNYKCDYKEDNLIDFISAQKINIGDMFAIPIYKLPKQTKFQIDMVEHGFTKDTFFDEEYIWQGIGGHKYQPGRKYPRYIEIDEDFAYIAGVFLGDGWTRGGKYTNETGFAFNETSSKEIESFKRVKKYFENKSYHLFETRYKKSLLQLRISDKTLRNVFRDIFGTDAFTKKIPEFLMVDNKKIVGSLLEGLMASDGHYDFKDNRLCYDSINYQLISQIQVLFSYMGMSSGIIKRVPHDTRKDFLNSHISYKLEFSGKQVTEIACEFLPLVKNFVKRKHSSNEFVKTETHFFTRNKTEPIYKKYKGKVYDLMVEKDHSFIANGCAVHNSGMGFILLYLLDITQINPLREETKTYPWRFLNPERVSPADIDVDIENIYRPKILSLLQHKYCGDDEKLGKRRVMKVQTLSTVKAKSAIQTAARGLGVTSEEAQFLSSFIIAPRGMQYNLTQTFYGDENENLLPNTEFVNLMTGKYKEVWNVAKSIEGLINGVGSHAGGVIITSKPIEKYCALMKTSSGDEITQYDLHQAEDAGLLKMDLLAVDCLTKIHICLNLLLQDNLIEWQGSLKDTYEKYIGVYNIERDNPEIWDMICDHKIISLFQMEKESGIQAIKVARPRSLTDLSALNSVMRLMAPEPGAESPLERYGRFRKNIQLWYDEMTEYGLNEHEQEVVKKYALANYGLLPNQENFMVIVQDPEIGGFSLLWADKLRKSVAKKKPKEFLQLQQEFYDNIEKKGLSPKLCHYVWDVLITMNKG